VTHPLRLAVIGDPISHSRSPAIHTAALAALGIDGTYDARRVPSSEMESVIEDLRAGLLDGVNVTMPLKGVAAALVDEITDEARRSGSVNTIVRLPDGRLKGYSTDITALGRLWPSDSEPVLILGAGGAAAAACLAARGRTLYVSARRAGTVAALADRLDSGTIVEVPWGTAVVDAVVVNATPLGMAGEPLPPRIVPLASALIDLAYGTEVTPAVAEARGLGLPTVDGLEFLVAQAADSFRLWTRREPPIDVMTEAALNPSSRAAEAPNHH
jgi:shikimate dehydrogenase